MDLHNLPQFPGEHGEGALEKKGDLPPFGETLSILFEFSIGLALANLLVAGFLVPCFGVGASVLVGEAPLLFGVFGLLIVLSKMSSLGHAAGVAYEEGRLGQTWLLARMGMLAIVMGTGLGIALGIGFALVLAQLFDYLHVLGRPIHSLLDNLIVGALIGALVGMIGAGGLILAGGTPDWKAGRFFTALGRLIPALLRSFIPKQPGEIHLRGKPWLEGIVWFAFAGGPFVWFFW